MPALFIIYTNILFLYIIYIFIYLIKFLNEEIYDISMIKYIHIMKRIIKENSHSFRGFLF